MYKSFRLSSIGRLGYKFREGLNAGKTCRAISTLDKLYPRHDYFSERHIGPSDEEKRAMLDFLGYKASILKFLKVGDNANRPFARIETNFIHCYMEGKVNNKTPRLRV